jgi:hypothetical protein
MGLWWRHGYMLEQSQPFAHKFFWAADCDKHPRA